MKNRPSIIICGQYACGKTSLIKVITPDGTVPDEIISDYADAICYETPVVDFIDAVALKVGESATDYWHKLQQKIQPESQKKQAGACPFFNWRQAPSPSPWDCVWYCIDASKAQLAEHDIQIIKLAGEQAIAVITKVELTDDAQLADLITELEKILPAERIITTSANNKIGLNKLLDTSKTLIFGELTAESTEAEQGRGAEWDSFFAENTTAWNETATQIAEQYLHWATGRAVAIATVPLPLADVIPLMGNEAYMIYRIGACYGYAVDATIIATFTGCIGGSIAGKVIASFIPFLKIPVAGAITYAIGRAAIAYFESDMTINEDNLKDIFTKAKTEWNELRGN